MKTINELAVEVINGKWGSGDARKKKLTQAGYDYYAVQDQVNKMLSMSTKILDACRKQADWMRNYTYNWKKWSPKTVEKSKEYGTCVTFVSCVLQRLGILKSGQYIANNGTGYGTGEVVGANSQMEVMYMGNKTLAQCKDLLIAGDVVMVDDNKSGKVGNGGHEFIVTGKWDKDGNPIIWDNASCNRVKQGKDGKHSYSKSRKVLCIIRMKTSKTYAGKLPTLKLVKTNAEVIADAIKFALWIAGDNSFHYGYTDKHGSKDSKKWKPNAHHNGCYFCGTNTDKGGRSKAGIVDYKKTYCCNPFVTAAWAHGGCVPAALKLCRLGSSWTFSKGKGYDASKLFDNLGKPAKKNLKKGYVLCSDTHVALYIGDGKIVEAAHGDDNKKHSESWNSSIRVTTLTDSRYNSFERVHRFNGSVNTTAYIGFGEVSDRVALLQSFLKWYGFDIASDRYFGEATVKAVQEFQAENGLEVDGKVGAKTLKKMSEVRK